MERKQLNFMKNNQLLLALILFIAIASCVSIQPIRTYKSYIVELIISEVGLNYNIIIVKDNEDKTYYLISSLVENYSKSNKEYLFEKIKSKKQYCMTLLKVDSSITLSSRFLNCVITLDCDSNKILWTNDKSYTRKAILDTVQFYYSPEITSNFIKIVNCD